MNSSKRDNATRADASSDGARVMLDGAGRAIFEFHVGSFDDRTNKASDNGTLLSLDYDVRDGAHGNRTVTSHEVSFHGNATSYLVHLDLCRPSSSDDGDDDGSGKALSCKTSWDSDYEHSYTAHIKGTGGHSDRTAQGRTPVFNLPDIDLSDQELFVVGAGGLQTLAGSVEPKSPTTFAVAIPNDKQVGGRSNMIGAEVACVVTVDGVPQLPLPNGVYNKYTNPNAFGFTGSAIEDIPAGATGSCQFTLSLPAGTHKIVVTAGVLYPFDFDPSNNSTKTFTVSSVVGGLPDVAIDVLHQAPDAPLDDPAIVASATKPTVFKQWVALASGRQPGNVTCTITSLNTTTHVATTASGTLSTTLPAACTVPITFSVPGVYQLTSVTSTPDDANLANNTAVTSVTVWGGPPSATVTLGQFSFNDPAVSASSALGATAGVEDLVYSGDLVTYSAAVNVASMINAGAVPIGCKVMDGATDITNTVSWIAGPTLNAVDTNGASCVFKYAFSMESNNSPHAHNLTISVSALAGVRNTATSGASVTGQITNENAVDIIGAPIRRVGDGTTAGATTIIPFDTTTYGQVVTIDGVFTNPTSHPTTIDCTINADQSLSPAAVNPAAVSNVPLPGGGTALCQYTVIPTALGPYAVSITATPHAGAPVDLNSANNASTASPTAKSGGAFELVPSADAINLTQTWINPLGEPTGTIASDGYLYQQIFPVTHLALVVVPTQDVLGSFSMTAHVTSGPTGQQSDFGTAVVPFQALSKSVGSPSCIGSITGASLNDPADPALSYTATICATDAPNRPGYQAITVSYTLSSGQVQPPSVPLLFSSSVTMTVGLDFSLAPNATSPDDHVHATIRIPVAAGVSCRENDFSTPATNQCSTVFGGAVITTP